MITSSIGKILVVDDEVELKNVLVEALASQGYETSGFTSGEDALAALRGEAFDVLLTDLMMPGMDGITLVKESLLIDPHLVCMVMTGQGTIQTAVDAMKEGAFDYVLKPFRLQTVLPVLTRAMNRRHMRLENLQLRETVAIYELGQTIAFTLDPQTVISKLADAALQQTDADEVSILLPAGEGPNELYVAAVRGENRERLLGERVPLDESISGWVAREREPLILDGEVNDQRFRSLCPHPEIRSAISIPMQVAGKLVGTININALDRPRPFTLGQMKALTILAGTAAAALESASLYSEVRTAEKNYRSIFENSIEGIFQASHQGRYLNVNPAMARILGYDSPTDLVESITNIDQQVFVHPERCADALNLIETTGSARDFEVEAYRKDGEKIWLSMNIRAVLSKDGEESYCEGTVEDITERKRTEIERLVMFEIIQGVSTGADLEALLKLIHQAIQKIVYAENCFVALYDEHHDTLDMQFFVDQHDSAPAPQKLGKSCAAHVFRTGKSLLINQELFDYLTEAGEVELVGEPSPSWLGVPLNTPAKTIGVLVVQHYEDDRAYSERDVEFLSSVGGQIAVAIERKQAEEVLRESEERYRDLVENNLELITTHDLNGQILSANRAAAEVLGYDREDRFGTKNVYELLAPEARDRFGEYLTRIRKDGVASGLMLVQTRTGENRIWEYHNTLRTEGVVTPIVRSVARDITERKRAEGRLAAQYVVTRALADSVTLAEATPKILRALCETLGSVWGALWAVDREANVLRCQEVWHDPSAEMAQFETASRRLAFAPGVGLPGRVWADGQPAWIRDVVQDKNFSRAPLAARATLQSALAIPIEAGSKVLGVMEFFGKTTREPDAELLAMMATVGSQIGQFIGRKQVDQNLRESEEKYRTILERMEEGYAEVDLRGTYVFVNDSFCRITGRSRSELLGLNYKEIFDREHRQLLYDTYHNVYVTGEPIQGFEYEVTRKDGAKRLVEESVSLRRDAEGRPIGFTGIRRDCTERKKGEAELRRLAAAVEETADSVVITDKKGNIQYVNPAFERVTGYTKEEALNQNPRILKSGKTDTAVYAELWETITRGGVWSGHLINRRKDGTFFEERVTISAIYDESHQIVNYVAVKQDISDLVLLEEQLRQSQKMEAIGQLAGGVAHDFNNLLTAINGYSALALQRLEDGHPIKSYLEEVKKAGDRAANLTRQLLAFGRKQILQPLALNLNSVVADMNKMLRRLIGEDIVLTAKLDPDVGKVMADPGQIEQVLVNLIVNARDAMPRGGDLTIETENVELDEEYGSKHVEVAPGKYVLLAVSDTGDGMAEEVRRRIFEPFFTTKEKGKGTGLGLSTVYGIVKQSGGNVTVYSEPGKGTTFKVYLPQVESGTREPKETVVEAAPLGGSETVLLVEDEEVVRGLARRILEQAGYSVVEAGKADEALRFCEEHAAEINLLLTDIVMPEMSGKELADKLRSQCPDLKMLFMSGYTDEAIVHHGVLDSDVGFIQKPFTPAALVKKLREVLDSNGTRSK